MTDQPDDGAPGPRPPDIWGGGPPRDAVGGVPGRQVDPALDPDRYDPDRYDPASEPLAGSVPLDMSRDPDRYAGDQTLTELLGEGAQEDPRDSYVWLAGLLSVLAFLALVALAARSLGP